MNSLELLKEKAPKTWWTALLVVILYSFVQGFSQEVLLKLFINEPLSLALSAFAMGLLFILLWVNLVEKNSVKTLGFHREEFLKSVGYGLLGAVCSVSIIVVIILFLDEISFEIVEDKHYVLIVSTIILFLIQGLTEEVIFRGYLMNRIASVKGRYWGLVVNSIFFSIFHAANPSVNYLSSLNIFLFGVVASLLFWYTDNIWLVGTLHGVWNFFMGVVLGINVSGIELPYTILKASVGENIIVSGGRFGIEGSVVTTVYYLLAAVAIYMALYYQMFRRIANKNK